MGNTPITKHSELLLRIAELKIEKYVQEEELKLTFKELVSTFNLVSIFKVATGTNKENPLEFLKTGLQMVVDLIIDLILGKHRSIKGFLSAVLVEKFTSTLIDNNVVNLVSGISSLFNKKSEPEKTQEKTKI